ncbi:hypothetical protein LSH36_561g01009 [Paralvinella palmiformis]|uniref:Cilia- and flagella-associated protein 61 N-terminal domain-containing protein n=1 Tax=Paralvinella palmiformis TaxID=53620 RepID=A0AAD9J5Z4_9ANNE|nr:hypothetical protein LSH36_561g01009 [Paralvinella palmiformis]
MLPLTLMARHMLGRTNECRAYLVLLGLMQGTTWRILMELSTCPKSSTMTTLTTPDGPSEIINARRTESLDAPSILKLVEPSTESLFGRVNVVNLIEKAVLAVTLSNDKDQVLGHAAFLDYPNLANVDQAFWEKWLCQYYDCKKCNAMNSLFMHYFVAKQEYSHGCAKEIIRTMFNAVPELHYCFLIVPKGVFPESSLADLFKEMDLVSKDKGPDGCVVFVCYRHDHVPVLHVRIAKVEDHDDLVPIFNRQSDMLKHTYGDYFLAELIEAQNENMHCIVAEVGGTAVGFMSLIRDVNTDLLNDCFELAPFNGLRKRHPDDILEPPQSNITPQPSPQIEEQERPESAQSARSRISQTSEVSRHSETEMEGSGLPPDRSESVEKSVSRINSGSTMDRGSDFTSKDDELRVRQKLSDADESRSLLSDNADVESLKSEAEERSLHDTPTLEVSLPDCTSSGVTEPVVARPPSQHAQVPKHFLPVYKGENSVFCIQLFCIDERYEMRSCDFLPKAFELFPEDDFCSITVPHLVPEFPLLQQFVRITPRVPSTLAQELYVFGRAGLLRGFKVRQACSSDYQGVEKLVKSLELNDNLLNDLQQYNKARRDVDGTEIQAFVADCHDQVVGVAIVRREEDIEYIRSHYNIEDFIYYNHHRREEHGHLHHYVLNPIFKHYSKTFLKEILRLGHKTCLYYPLYPGYVERKILEKHTLVAALNDMVPVRARRQIVYPLEILGSNAPSTRVLKQQEQYALNHINRKLTMEPKVTINARIVVVGASDVGIAFLETFAFCPHLRFSNLTLISPHGLPGELPPDELQDQMITKRKKKHVMVNYDTVVPYDHLVIATGVQYQVPAPTGADVNQLMTSSEIEFSPDRRFDGVPPKNVFIINDTYEAAVVLYWVEHNLLKSDGRAVIYGSCLDAYSCVSTLLNVGITGDRIIVVEPPLTSKMTCLNNGTLDKALTKVLAEEGVQVHSGYLLAQWNDGEDDEEIHSVSFTSETKPLRLDTMAFFSFYKKQVDYEAFKAINDACLVFDGHLVIDATFHTTDVAIRGAGPITKFQRSYHADEWTHANFNSKEVGMQLCHDTNLHLYIAEKEHIETFS